MKIGVVCADKRMQHVASLLSKEYAVTEVYEEKDLYKERQFDVFILPVSGIDAHGDVKMYDHILHIPSSFWFQQGVNLIVFSGTLNKGNAECPLWFCYMKDEEVIMQNAILTAEGVLNGIIGATSKSIYAHQVDIIGFGYCGKAIYEMLKNLHVPVKVIRREADNRKNFMSIQEWKQCGDIIIHTAIGPMIDESMVAQWEKKPIIIDIATPQLLPLEALEKHGCTVIKAPNLPGRYAYMSAAKIIVEYIRRKLTYEK